MTPPQIVSRGPELEAGARQRRGSSSEGLDIVRIINSSCMHMISTKNMCVCEKVTHPLNWHPRSTGFQQLRNCC